MGAARSVAAEPVRQAKRIDKKLSTSKFTKLGYSIGTSPFRSANNARLAGQRGQSMRGAVSRTRVGNTSVLKVGRVTAAVAATYATAGAAGAAIGVAGVGTAAASAMAVTGAGQLATQGYLSEKGLITSGLQGGAGAVAGRVPGVDTYRKLRALKDARDRLQEQQRQRALNQQEQAELAQLEGDYAAEEARVAQEAKAERTGSAVPVAEQKKNPLPLVAGGLVALKVLALVA